MSKPSLVLLPGLMCDASIWQSQINNLSDVVAIIVPDLSKAKTPEEMVEAVLKVAPPSFMLVGHSMGGWVALEVMKIAPDRVGKLCLANTTAKPDSQEKSNARKEMIEQAMRGKFEDIINQLAEKFVYQKQHLQTVKEILRRNQHAFINQEQAMLIRQSCVPILDEINCATLVIHSIQDAVFHIDDSLQLSSRIIDADLAVIEEAGHMSQIEQPEQFTALMREWLMSPISPLQNK